MIMLRFYTVILILLIIPNTFVQGDDEYVIESYIKCKTSNSFYNCAKYYVIKFISDMNFGPSKEATSNLTKSEVIEKTDASLKYEEADNEFVKIYKFLRRKIENFFEDESWNYVFPEEAFSSKRALVTNFENFDEGNYFLCAV